MTFFDWPDFVKRSLLAAMVWFLLGVGPAARAESARLNICLVAGASPTVDEVENSLSLCKKFLETEFKAAVVLVRSGTRGAGPSLAPLRSCDAALLYASDGELSTENAAILRELLDSGKGLVVVRSSLAQWKAWPDFSQQVLGAKPGGRFADGYPLHVINLFPHAIFTGVARLDTRQQMPLYTDLAGDVQMLIEGTVGEATAPLAWVRRVGSSRVCSVLPGEAGLFRDDAYLRMLGNALLWTARRPIPGARAIIQRTYLTDAYPGAFAVTLPGGPVFCWDPVRGGMSQVWDGDFADLRPRWTTKQGQPARLGGEAFFRDSGRGSFWVGTDTGDVAYQFQGYSNAGEYPEFFYQVGDRTIREEMRPLASGQGVSRRFHVGPGSTPLWYKIDPQSAAEVVATGLQQDDRGLAFSSKAAGEFTIEIREKKINAP